MVTLKQIVATYISTLKKFFLKMGFNTKRIVTGDEALKKIENKASTNLSEQEINFILAKLRQAQYTGAEFEMFHNVWIKLSDLK
jgi:phosphate starvation-inducible protein PhoH